MPESATMRRVVLVLGTGGTIAQKTAGAAEIPVGELLGAAVAGPTRSRQVVQLRSADLGFDDLRAIAAATADGMADPEIAGIVVTHGTDTLEETAFVLDQTLACAKPVVLTGAMRMASDAAFDGLANLRDAVAATETLPPGVFGVLGGAVFWAADLAKRHGDAFDALTSPNLGQLGHAGARLCLPPFRRQAPLPMPAIWPRVPVLPVWLGSDAADWEALAAGRPDGLVIAGSGSGNIPARLHPLVRAFSDRGIPVLRASRTGAGAVRAGGETDDGALGTLPAGWLSPGKARLFLGLCVAAGLDHAAIAGRLEGIDAVFAALGAPPHNSFPTRQP